MTWHEEWLTNFDSNKKTNVGLADSRNLAAEGIKDIAIKRKYGKKALI